MNANIGGPLQLFGREHMVNLGVDARRDWSRNASYTTSTPAPGIPSVYDWYGQYPNSDWTKTSDGEWAIGNTRSSVYASAKLSLADPLKAIIGIRYNDWKSDTRHFTNLTPYAGLVYDLNDTYSAYASYTEIFAPQNAKDRNGYYLDPTLGKSYEAGVKAEYLEGRVNASLSVYKTFKDNVATLDDGYFVPGTTDRAYYGAKGVESKGIELEVAGEVAEGWNLFFGANTLKMLDAAGKRRETVLPTRTLRIFTTYELPGEWSDWTVGGGIRWQNKTWKDIATTEGSFTFTQPSYAVTDLMIRYNLAENWSAQMNINNVFDKVYYNNAAYEVRYGDPRNVTLMLKTSF